MENKAPKLSFREKLGYGLGTASLNLIFNIVSTYLLFFYTKCLWIETSRCCYDVSSCSYY